MSEEQILAVCRCKLQAQVLADLLDEKETELADLVQGCNHRDQDGEPMISVDVEKGTGEMYCPMCDTVMMA